MITLKKFFNPGKDRDEAGSNSEQKRNQDESETDKKTEAAGIVNEEKNGSTIHDALQQWSNDNARDIAEDDSTPLRSGL